MPKKIPSEKEAIGLLKKYSKDSKSYRAVYSHSRTVMNLAISIAMKISKIHPEIKIDMELIKTGSILHDIGRFDYPPGKESVKHGARGSAIMRKEGLSQIALICERHVGPGITLTEVVKNNLPIPKKDYTPKSLEEKIISYADKLVFGTRKVSPKIAIERFRKEIGPESGQRMANLHKEIISLMKK